MDKETSAKRQLEKYLHHFGQVTIDVLPSVLPISEASDDLTEREKIGDQVGSNLWAWCVVEVKVTFKGLTQSDYMTGSWHGGEAEFRESDTYQDMLHECVSRLADRVLDIFFIVSRVTN